MNANIEHLALSVSVAVVLLCVFAGVSMGIASAKAIYVSNDHPALQQGIGTATMMNASGGLTGPHAQFHLNKDFHVWTEDDAIISGMYELNIGYWMDIQNENDTSDTILGNLSFSAQADNVTEVDWEEYAEWDESHVEWSFPPYPEFIIEEDDDFGTGFGTSYSETRDIDVDLSRWMNITVFDSEAYQLAEFTVTFRDDDFMCCWGDIEVNKHREVRASIVPDTFRTDTPLDWIDVEKHGVHFEFNKSQIEKDVPYNFAVVIKVELTGNEAPPILYKPEFNIGLGIYYKDFALAGRRYTAEMPAGMLPDNVNYASVTTNVSNYWTLKRHNQIIAVLEEVVELAGPHAEFHFNKDFNVWTERDTLTSGAYESDRCYWMYIENKEDTSGTVLSNISFGIKAGNITDVDWEEYADWNESSVEWNFPPYPRFTIEEGEEFGTGFSRGSEIRDVDVSVSRRMNITEFNSSGYQLAKFNVTFGDTNFEWVWAKIEANEHHEIKASIVPGSFTYDAPLDNFDVREHGIHFNFDKERIEIGVAYNFSVLVKVELTGKEALPILYKPKFKIGEGLCHNSTTLQGYRYTAEMPSSMLPDNVSYASVMTNISNVWLLKRHDHATAELKEVSEFVGGAISGRVCEADSITPIERATIEAIPVEGGKWRETKTASDGKYTIKGLPTGKYKVRAFKSGYAREYYDNEVPSHEATIISVTAPTETSNINFNLTEGGSISGRIYQSDGYTPIAGALVSVRPSKYSLDDGFWTTTNSDGGYKVEGLSLGNFKVMAGAPGYTGVRYYNGDGGIYGWDNACNVKVTPPDDTSDININLHLAALISGYVYESDGVTPIPSVHIIADTSYSYPGLEGFVSTTNEEGYYVIEGLPPLNYTLRAHKPQGYASEFYDGKTNLGAADYITVAEGEEVTGKNFTLEVGGRISGHVYTEEGKLISGAHIDFFDPPGHDWVVDGVITDPLGRYELWLRTGDYIVRVGAPGYVGEEREVSVIAPNETSGIDFYLSKAGSISGHVYSEEGNPIGDANVYAFSDIYPGSGANTQSDGSYIIEGLPSGNYTVQVTVSGYVSEYYDNVTDAVNATKVTVNAPDDTPDINFTLN